MSDLPFPHPYIILDTYCLASMYASGLMETILTSLPVQIAIASDVQDKEIRRMRIVVDEDASMNLQALAIKRLVVMVHLEDNLEQITAVNLAALSKGKLGNGDAISAAIAVHRHWSFGTDDKDTLRLLQRNQPDLHIVSVLDLLKYWADTTQAQFSTVHNALKTIRKRASYKPHSDHHLYRWWQKYFSDNL